MTATQLHPAVAADRRRRRDRREAYVIQLFANLLAVLAGGWLFMFAVGIVHHEWIVQCPTLGYTTSVALAALLRGALAPIPRPKRSGVSP